MADPFDFLGSNLPFYIVVTLFFSYLVWSRFINKGNLKPTKANHIIEIFALFAFIFTYIAGFVALIVIVGNTIDLSTNLGIIWENVKAYVSVFVPIAGLYFLAIYKDKKAGQKSLEKVYLIMIKFLIFYVIYLISVIIFILQTVIGNLMLSMIIPFIYVIICIIFSIMILNIAVFKIKIKDLLTRSVLIISILILIVSTISLNLLFKPILTTEKPIFMEYHIYNPDKNWGEAYLRAQIPFRIDSLGRFYALVNILPIKYKEFNIKVDDKGDKNFNIFLTFSNSTQLGKLISGYSQVDTYNKQPIKYYNFTGIFSDVNSGLVALQFDRLNIKNEKINKIILDGFIKKKMSEIDYVYTPQIYQSSCFGTGCSFTINISNNVTSPILQEEQVLINPSNMNIYNKTKCVFSNLTIATNNDLKLLVYQSCKERHCYINIRDKEIIGETLDTNLYFDDNSIIWFGSTIIKEPINLFLIVNITC